MNHRWIEVIEVWSDEGMVWYGRENKSTGEKWLDDKYICHESQVGIYSALRSHSDIGCYVHSCFGSSLGSGGGSSSIHWESNILC